LPLKSETVRRWRMFRRLFFRRTPARLLLQRGEREGQLCSFFTETVRGSQLNGKLARPVQSDGEGAGRYEAHVVGNILVDFHRGGLGHWFAAFIKNPHLHG